MFRNHHSSFFVGSINLVISMILVMSFASDGLADRVQNRQAEYLSYLPIVAQSVSFHESTGTLDKDFDGDGLLVTDLFGGRDFGNAIAIQPDGKIVVAGVAESGIDWDFALVRYNSDGSLDATFDDDGLVVTDIGSSRDVGKVVAIQGDGRIVVGGYTGQYPDENFALARYNPDGSLDASFDSDGLVVTDFYGGLDEGIKITLQPDNKIVLAGSADNGKDSDFALARYNSDGSLDTSFDGDGLQLTDISGSDDWGAAITLQPDNNIFMVGYFYQDSRYYCALARYRSDGSLDSSFNSDGILVTDITGVSDQCFALTLQPDGKVVVVGSTWEKYHDIILARFNPDGSLDTEFDIDGWLAVDFGGGDDYSIAIILQPNGKLVVAGSTDDGTDSDILLARFNPDGSPDTVFDSDGWLATDFFSHDDYGNSVVLQLDSRIIVAGTAYNGTDFDFALARYK